MSHRQAEPGAAALPATAEVRNEAHGSFTSSAALQSSVQPQAMEQSALSICHVAFDVIPGIFSFERGGIFVNDPTPEMLARFGRDLGVYFDEPGLIATIVRALGEAWGKPVAKLAGFVPIDGGGVVYDDFIVFGRIYMPEVAGCRALFKLSRETSQSADLKISLSGFAGGEGSKLWCRLSQEDELRASPKDLVIPVKVKVTTWRRYDGRSFATFSVLNYGKSIVTKQAQNPFFGSSGYDHLDNTVKGAIDRVHGGIGLGEFKREVEVGARRSYQLKAKLTLSTGYTVELGGEVEVLSKISVFYLLPPTHDYLRIDGEQSPIEHYWAWRGALGR